MGKPKAPAPPDPRQTAAGSTSTNVGTAIANTMMQNVGQVGPGGSLRYDQTGTHTWNDPYTQQSYDIPTFTATTSLSPEMQEIYSGLNRQAGNVVGNLSSEPIRDFSEYRDEAQNALMSRMEPQFARDRESMETRLANQGIGMGARAYGAAQDDFGRSVNDARLGAILAGGDEQARLMQMDAAARAQPINEITALLSGGQVATPQFQINRPSGIPTTDVGGLINQNFAQRQGNYQQANANWQSGMGGLFGMGAALLSDERAKTDVRKVGETDGGLPIYTYRYKGGDTRHMGVMAQDVQKQNPDAVKQRNDGLLAVDYSKVS